METFDTMMQRGGAAAIGAASRFFMKDDPVHQSLKSIAARLAALKIPYRIAGGMALVAHGYDRTTADIDLVVTEAGLAAIHENLEGRGYVRIFANSRSLRDTQTQVRIEFLVAGQFPGDGKPKPIAFPDPEGEGVQIDGISFLGLSTLVELKLASGMSAPHRLRDLADVQELIRVLKLPLAFREQLNSWVQEKFSELWSAIKDAPAEE